MSAYRWLQFTLGIPLLALLYALLTEFVRPGISVLHSQSSTSASAQGITWFEQFWEWLPLVLLLLLAFSLVVAITVRRRQVVR